MAGLYDQLWGQPQEAPRQSMFAGAQQAVNAIPVSQPAPRQSRPGLLDYVWGVAAGYNPNDISRMHQARGQSEQAAAAERARLAEVESYARGQGPAALAAFATNPEEYGKAVSSGLESYTLNSGGTRFGPNGQPIAAPLRIERFDDRFGVIDPLNPTAGAAYTAPRGPSQSEMLTAANQALEQAQFDRRLGLDERRLAADTAISQSELGIKQADLGLRQTEAQREVERAAQATEGQLSQQVQTAASMEQALTRGREYISAAGAWTNLNPLQRQNRANLEGQIDTLKGNLTFDRLMEMKNSSPTGASGLGALSEGEARMLAATVASLSPDMSPRELERSFQVIDGLVSKMKDTSGGPARAGQPSREALLAEARRRGLIR